MLVKNYFTIAVAQIREAQRVYLQGEIQRRLASEMADNDPNVQPASKNHAMPDKDHDEQTEG